MNIDDQQIYHYHTPFITANRLLSVRESKIRVHSPYLAQGFAHTFPPGHRVVAPPRHPDPRDASFRVKFEELEPCNREKKSLTVLQTARLSQRRNINRILQARVSRLTAENGKTVDLNARFKTTVWEGI
jgi:hypothetical protein